MSSNHQVSTDVLSIIFQNQITEQQLAELKAKFPSDIVYDMTNDDTYKIGRKARTERNKLTKAINDRRISITKTIKEKGDDLIEQVEDVYSVIVSPFEAEDDARKKEKARRAAERETFLNSQRDEIQAIRNFVPDCANKSSEYIAGCIEAVSIIEVDHFDPELIHEALKVKDDVTTALYNLREDALKRERLAEQQKEADQRDALSQISNTPMTMFNSSSEDIKAAIAKLDATVINEDTYGDISAAKQAVHNATSQLNQILDMATAREAAQPITTKAANDDQPELAADEDTSESFELKYEPFTNWPSDVRRAQDPAVDMICKKLEEAEKHIELLEEMLSQQAA
ncbi:hypothetical protein N473_01475 [Pseudoalteromonas luteoviolacea CPMOR-1]|uniref:Uncharacterized protein n=1 Tax=Pseudoalteromonas luteoviolacea CPMOR-1 TaxID=1365248 RepID=A0A167LUZ8_9GAMM|nr:hypothetical protein [Pseudoalteromonas luteoviolacea]KZN65268.1 hypothetical protein N473_01475 [Pseudoalteromonas luteoviolacea CPMOR-1]